MPDLRQPEKHTEVFRKCHKGNVYLFDYQYIVSATDSHEHCGVPQSVRLGTSGCGGGTGTCSDHYQHSNGSHFLPDCKSKENGLMYTIGIIEQDKALGDAMEQVLDEKGILQCGRIPSQMPGSYFSRLLWIWWY